MTLLLPLDTSRRFPRGNTNLVGEMIGVQDRLGALLVELGLLEEEQLALGMRLSRDSGRRLIKVLSEEGIVEEKIFADVLVNQLGLPRWDPKRWPPKPDASGVLAPDRAFEACAIPLSRNLEGGRDTVVIACSDPLHAQASQVVRLLSQDGFAVRWVVGVESQIEAALESVHKRMALDYGAETPTVIFDSQDLRQWIESPEIARQLHNKRVSEEAVTTAKRQLQRLNHMRTDESLDVIVVDDHSTDILAEETVSPTQIMSGDAPIFGETNAEMEFEIGFGDVVSEESLIDVESPIPESADRNLVMFDFEPTAEYAEVADTSREMSRHIEDHGAVYPKTPAEESAPSDPSSLSLAPTERPSSRQEESYARRRRTPVKPRVRPATGARASRLPAADPSNQRVGGDPVDQRSEVLTKDLSVAPDAGSLYPIKEITNEMVVPFGSQNSPTTHSKTQYSADLGDNSPAIASGKLYYLLERYARGEYLESSEIDACLRTVVATLLEQGWFDPSKLNKALSTSDDASTRF